MTLQRFSKVSFNSDISGNAKKFKKSLMILNKSELIELM